jgi:hypothetical protein
MGQVISDPWSCWFVQRLTSFLEEPIDVADLFRYQRYRWLYVVSIDILGAV